MRRVVAVSAEVVGSGVAGCELGRAAVTGQGPRAADDVVVGCGDVLGTCLVAGLRGARAPRVRLSWGAALRVERTRLARE